MLCSCLLAFRRTKPLKLALPGIRPKLNTFASVTETTRKPSVEIKGLKIPYRMFSLFYSRLNVNGLTNGAKFYPKARSFHTRLNSALFRGARCNSFNKMNSIFCRMQSGSGQYRKKLFEKHKSVAMYALSLAILVGGGSYAAVPLYRLYCQASGYGGTVRVADIGEKIENMERKKDRILKVKFNADKGATMRWNFKPRQSEIKIVPGETALAFYTAKNPTDVPITGISTYNVIPFEAGQYFNKIQCFCFEEQRLNPGEEVDMPVFFYIDPEFVEDPYLSKVTEITLSYTFFEARDVSWPDLQKQQNATK